MGDILNRLECDTLIERFKEHVVAEPSHIRSLSDKDWLELVTEISLRRKLAIEFPNVCTKTADTISINSSDADSSFLNQTQSSINENSLIFSPPPCKKSKNIYRNFKEEITLHKLLQKHHLTEKLTNEQRQILMASS